MRAAARGVIDFRDADIHTERWWRKTNAVIEAMARDDDLVTKRAAFDYQLALVGNPRLSSESFDTARKLAKEYFGDIFNNVHPWAAKSLEQRQGDEVADLIGAYKQMVGDPNDPAFRAKLMRDITESRRRRAERRVKRESEEDRISRLVAARDRRLAVARRAR